MILENLKEIENGKHLPIIALKALFHFKFKHQQIQKDLNTLIKKKFTVIEKKSKSFLSKKKETNPNASIFFNAVYLGKKNKNNLPNGMGNILYNTGDKDNDDNDMYCGELKNGLKNGIGKYTYFANRNIGKHPFTVPYYIGEWIADSYYGLGKKIIDQFDDEMVYEGNFANDKITGFGNYQNISSNSEMIGYFDDGTPINLIVEIHKDSKGKLSNKKESGLFEYDNQKRNKNVLMPFKDKNIWEEIKIPKNYKTDKAMLSLLYNDWYGGYIKWDVFSKKFKDLKIELKEKVISLMYVSNEYYVNNSNNKEYLKLINNINELNKKISSADKSDDLLLLKNELKKEVNQFSTIKGKLKKVY